MHKTDGMFDRRRRGPLSTSSAGGVGAALLLGAVLGALLAVGRLPAAESSAPPKPRVLVDFENPQAVRLGANQAKATIVAADGGHALEIVTQAEADYPGVLIEPADGKWNLEGFDAVEMDVRNPQDVPVRVLLSINNPGADGRNHCNTESVGVPAGGKATLVVPFGMWHGDPGHPIDQSDVVSFNVLLDRPGRAHRFAVDNIRAVTEDSAESRRYVAAPFFRQLQPIFGRGINLGNALEAPREGDWGVTLKQEYFEAIRQAGFDSVRIPVRWSAHAEASAPYRIDAKFFERVDWAVEEALKRKLLVVLNMHHYEEIFNRPDDHRERFLAMWEQIAARYKDAPPALAFELLNEPHASLDAATWNRLLAEALAVVRKSNPTRWVVVGPVGWNNINDLPSLVLPEDDRRLVVTVHYYSPFRFTHQGAGWVGPAAVQWLGTKWNGTRAEQQAIERDFDRAINWAVERKRPIYLGEFGAIERADLDSRARWTRCVAEEALKRKMGYAYWEFCSGFGTYDAQRGQWVQPLRDALLPLRGADRPR